MKRLLADVAGLAAVAAACYAITVVTDMAINALAPAPHAPARRSQHDFDLAFWSYVQDPL